MTPAAAAASLIATVLDTYSIDAERLDALLAAVEALEYLDTPPDPERTIE